ncbi:MAG: acyl-CoA thioesterase [Deltaproteobacteria bacterium]|nr:acyl-CoA thioesterase [Deltaproteobacteria bacterium]
MTTPLPSDASRTTMTEILLPTHANALGNAFGGQILAWMDICAAICAQRHAGLVCVTAGLDDLSFERPIKVGEVVQLEARVTAVFRSSFEVRVVVRGENPLTHTVWPCVEAYLTFVAIDAGGKPTAVPALAVATQDDERLKANAHVRREQRLARRKAAAGG